MQEGEVYLASATRSSRNSNESYEQAEDRKLIQGCSQLCSCQASLLLSQEGLPVMDGLGPFSYVLFPYGSPHLIF